jgi:AcrR family transcriptional regulator
MAKPAVRTRRPSRDERKRQTRAELLATARSVFEERGFHAASLEEIAEAAGYSKGAIYSNFAGKDELLLAVLTEHLDRRTRALVEVGLDQDSFEKGIRAVARSGVELGRREPAWTPLLVEFWIHASRREKLRTAVLALHERQLDGLAALVEELGRRHGRRFRIPPRHVVRGTGALGRGMALERLLDPDAAYADAYEELFVAATLGVTE